MTRMIVALACTLALTLLGCDRAVSSVGSLPCSGVQPERCVQPQGKAVTLATTVVDAERESASTLVWQREIAHGDCSSWQCIVPPEQAFLVLDDGEVIVATLRMALPNGELRVTWFDAAGELVFESTVPGSKAALVHERLSRLSLERDSDSSVSLFFAHIRTTPQAYFGSADVFRISRDGRIEASFGVDTGHTRPGPAASLASDLVIANDGFDQPLEIARYRRAKKMQWRRPDLVLEPEEADVGVALHSEFQPLLLGLAVDARSRIWGVLSEGVLGVVQLDPDGFVAAHVWVAAPLPKDTIWSAPMAFDSRDHLFVGMGDTLLRFEPDLDEPELSPLPAVTTLQEGFYPCTVDAIAIDAQDRIYIGTLDGPRSARRLLVDRVSNDFATRERFTVPLPKEEVMAHRIRGLQLDASGDVYVRVVRDNLDPLDELDEMGQRVFRDEPDRLLRLHLSEPGAQK